jgi:hypothetical protein
VSVDPHDQRTRYPTDARSIEEQALVEGWRRPPR